MKKFIVFLFTLVLSFSVVGIGNATLIDNGNNLIYDSDLNITWYAVANNTGIDWADANSWASGLNLGGESGWRLPTTPGTTIGYSNEGEMGHLFYDELGGLAGIPIETTHNANYALFTNLVSMTSAWYWSKEENTDWAWWFSFSNGWQTLDYKVFEVYALAVHDGDVGEGGTTRVPEPATMLLLGLGLMGLAGVRRKIKK